MGRGDLPAFSRDAGGFPFASWFPRPSCGSLSGCGRTQHQPTSKVVLGHAR
ncbi:hypothetical protein KD918_18435 [Acinetobacter baumannii]|uniref:hypothetical protein n=1 Tax=Gammaproteobacteria TaxID=1236 RepID=UPI001596F30D|nr:hypothetical protein [Acinetobacter baumannii]EKT9844718.1 hypothetical protein [Acinetobacter baumannii]EKV6546904.1 hypothetical protein [Acinetobacter baumannii]MBK3348137.1 hypothetical protein [Acinetobacter baumannii]MBR8591402.1 hypothetical protein [Acinetobacter baumannii]MCO9055264.1 hypothetical protein [Acinetobacter baumannii]